MQYVNEATRLDQLGVARGKFIITDSSGVSAIVDLTQGNEQTLEDVIQEINSRGLMINTRINNNGDDILIEDNGPGNVELMVEDSGSTTARDLGIAGQGTNPGDDLNESFEKTVSFSSGQLTSTTPLVTLNDGDGVDIKSRLDDFRITTRDGNTHDVNLDGVTTINDVIVAISAATAGDVTAAIGALGISLVLTDNMAGATIFQVTALNSSNAAQDLGIQASSLLVTSTANQLTNTIPGATINLLVTSSAPVQVTITKDIEASVSSVKRFVDDFKNVVDRIDELASYNSETEQRGLLLGDVAVAQVRRQLFNAVINRSTDLTGQFTVLSQVWASRRVVERGFSSVKPSFAMRSIPIPARSRLYSRSNRPRPSRTEPRPLPRPARWREDR